jgi:hypothetical protein
MDPSALRRSRPSMAYMRAHAELWCWTLDGETSREATWSFIVYRKLTMARWWQRSAPQLPYVRSIIWPPLDAAAAVSSCGQGQMDRSTAE